MCDLTQSQTDEFKLVSHARSSNSSRQASASSGQSGSAHSSFSGASNSGAGSAGGNRRRKKKMQKVDPASFLAFGVNGADEPNRGEIQSPES